MQTIANEHFFCFYAPLEHVDDEMTGNLLILWWLFHGLWVI